jgi:signal transduction histidine kinase
VAGLISVVELRAKVERLVADRKRGAAELRDLRRFAQQLLNTRDQERREVTCWLIDNTVQSMAAIKMSLSMAKDTVVTLDPEMQSVLADAVALLDRCASEIETKCAVLYPPLLDNLGLPAAMAWHIKRFNESCGARAVLDVPRDLGRLPHEHEVALFRIMQESLGSLRRYPARRNAKVHVYRRAAEAVIEVTDAGYTKRPNSEISERVRQFGGRLEIVSGPRCATLRVTLPLTRRHTRPQLA